ncbi:glycoside hydrolase family 113 [Winogradskyella sp.]|uniref:glycoside hydrolase family 113 n=1 Tax=Winogradskyella sp. TaxID=1883156 RepID=UPI003F6D42DD
MRYFLYAVLSLMLLGCSAAPFTPKKINGVSFVASGSPVDSTNIAPVVAVNANFAAIMPFGFIRDLDHPRIIHNTDRQWFGETRAGAKQYIQELAKSNIAVMIKPQLWVGRGQFTGEIMMQSENTWMKLEASYRDFILEYAKLAKEVQADILCIGTELELFTKYRPEYWNALIDEIRLIYNGKLTYAANWNEYRKTPFWDKLDYIGIDAYFPVSDNKTPSVEDCIVGWEKHKPEIVKFTNSHKKQVLFTEYGYRSVDFTGKQPWDYNRGSGLVNLDAQVNATEALFKTFWDEDWFAGGFVWKWFHSHDRVGGLQNNMFTPQNKPVEEVIKNYYKTY